MQIKRFLIVAMLFLIIPAVFQSCGKDDTEPEQNTDETPGNIPGMGEAEGSPEGDLFKLPEGIRLTGSMIGIDCNDGDELGSGINVTVCIKLYNEKSENVELNLPTGLVFVCDDASYQNGMLLQGTKIILPGKTNTNFTLFLYCINAARGSSDSDAIFQFGPVTKSALIKELADLISTKKINLAEYQGETLGYYEAVSAVQSAVWSITDSPDGLTDYDREAIAQLPNK
ncbi:hypothetical protein [Parapedobacter tibetensis]|uniref:hypothetical protein n=1 Tax=Parapedobacter tibetensis TaxID=2972951 RepID=UPI00214DAC30|nr:hypothetical protein [Parapedobacter tibetensis]